MFSSNLLAENNTEWTLNNSVSIPWPTESPNEIDAVEQTTTGATLPTNKTEKDEWPDYSSEDDTSKDADWFSVKELWINKTMKVQPRLTDGKSARIFIPKGPSGPRDERPNNASLEGGNWDSESPV